MNTESNQENEPTLTVGEQLRQAREQLGLSMKDVAEQLCLKQSTVNYIEDGVNPDGLAPTFIRGYIRAYARLVNLTSVDLLPPLQPEQLSQSMRDVRISTPVKGFPLAKSHRKRESWIMPITWLIIIVLVGLTGFWWWQDYNLEKNTISTGNINVSTSGQAGAGMPIRLSSSSSSDSETVTQTPPVQNSNSINISNAQPPAAVANTNVATTNIATNVTSNANVTTNGASVLTVASLLQQKMPPLPNVQAKLNAESAARQAIIFDTLFMTFTDDCWLSVVDASGKTLFSGLKKRGQALDVSGKPPYRVRLGAPSAVQIQFQGKEVDLSRIKNGSVLVVAP